MRQSPSGTGSIDPDRLERAARRIDLITRETEDFYQRTKLSAEICELRNLASVAGLVVACARRRHESRGPHTMTDFPDADPLQVHDTVLRADIEAPRRRPVRVQEEAVKPTL